MYIILSIHIIINNILLLFYKRYLKVNFEAPTSHSPFQLSALALIYFI